MKNYLGNENKMNTAERMNESFWNNQASVSYDIPVVFEGYENKVMNTAERMNESFWNNLKGVSHDIPKTFNGYENQIPVK